MISLWGRSPKVDVDAGWLPDVLPKEGFDDLQLLTPVHMVGRGGGGEAEEEQEEGEGRSREEGRSRGEEEEQAPL